MNRDLLLDLGRLSTANLTTIREQHNELFTQLQQNVATARRTVVQDVFSGGSPELQTAIGKVDLSDSTRPIEDLLVKGLQAQKPAAAVMQEAAQRLLDAKNSGRLRDPALPDIPVEQHPLFQADLQRAQVARLTQAAGIPTDRASKLTDSVSSVAGLSDDDLAAAVSAKTISVDEARSIGLTGTVSGIAGGRLEVATALRKDGLPSVPGGTLTQVTDLVHLSATDWQSVLDKAKVAPPDGMDLTAYGKQLRATVTQLFPTDSMLALVARPAQEAAQAVLGVAPLLERNPGGFGRPFVELKTDGLSADQVKASRDSYDRVMELAMVRPGTHIADVLNGPGSADEKAKTVGARLGVLQRFTAQNPEAELLTLDYAPQSEDLASLKFDGIADADRAIVLDDLKACQRTFAVTSDVDDAHALLRAGYSSALSIGTGTAESFASRSGLTAEVAARYYQNAKNAVATVSHTAISVIDIMGGSFRHLGSLFNVDFSVEDHLKAIPGYADLFGSQNFCHCQHCESVLSPAAYFVDLMHFVQEHVLDTVFTGAKANHPINLKVRRPDLWTLALTCHNTDTVIPYLDIIDVVLENHIARIRGFAGSLDDRTAVEEAVYHQAIASAVDSMRQPFSLPLHRIDAYLGHFQRTRADIGRAIAAGDRAIAAATLHISKPEFDLAAARNADLAFLRRLYGLPLPDAGGTVQPVDVQDMLRSIRVSRTELTQLLQAAWVATAAQPAPNVVAEKSSPQSVQNDVEHIHDLTAESLDRMHRLIRVWRAVGWSVPETDLAIAQLSAAGLSTGIEESALIRLGQVLALQARWSLAVDESLALFSAIPRTTVDMRPALFDRLFNLPVFVAPDGPLPKDAVKFVHPAFRATGVPLPADNTLHRLLAGLQVGSDDLAQLITHLAAPLGARLDTANEDDRGFALTLANLSVLYRHARLAQLLHLSIADLFQLIGHAGLAGGSVSGLDALLTLLDVEDWWRSSGFSLDDLSVITRGTPQQPSRYADPAATASAVVAALASDKAFDFADTVFAFLPGVTESQSRAIVAANAGAVRPSQQGGALRLVPGFNPSAPLAVPAGVDVAEPDARALLMKYHASQVLPPRVASQLSIAADKARGLIGLTGANLSDPAMVQALQGGAVVSLVTMLQALVPLSVALRNDAYDAAALDWLRTHGGVFGIADFTALAVPGVRKLSVYTRFTDSSAQAMFHPAAPTVDPALVRQVLGGFDPGSRFSGVDQRSLATVLGIDATVLATIVPNVTLPAIAPDGLAALAGVAQLATYIGVGGETLKLIVSEDYGDLSRAAEAVLSAFRAKYLDPADFQAKVDPYEDVVRGRRRDALTEYLTHSIAPVFSSLDELYQFFLLDVQLEGCARTSLLVAAISSVQLYVERCLLDLEQDRRDPSDPEHVHVPPESIPAGEWSWRKYYRVWEANRKVFLFPENYIEPDLRDDKTPLFRDLEAQLLSQQINSQNVLDAYGIYLSGFDEISKLRIAGMFHEIDPVTKSDVLHLFGVTPSDPPVYYYRTIENILHSQKEADRGIVWGPWRKVQVQIPVRKVAPVVYLGRLFVFWVEVTTATKNKVENAGSQFVGYKHHLILKYTSLRLDGTWSSPNSIALLDPGAFGGGEGIVDDPLAEPSEVAALTNAVNSFDFQGILNAQVAMQTPRYDSRIHLDPIDGYTLRGFQWDQVYPQVKSDSALSLTFRNFVVRAGVDFYTKSIAAHNVWDWQPGIPQLLCARHDGGQHNLYYGVQPVFFIPGYAEASVAAEDVRLLKLQQTGETALLGSLLGYGLYSRSIATLLGAVDVDVVNGSLTDAILDFSGDILYIQGSVRPFHQFVLRRLGTTLGETLSRTLFSGGVDLLLDIHTQEALAEAPLPLNVLSQIENRGNAGSLDFRGSLGTYFREIFLYVPFLIANHLNSQQQFEASQHWYHRIFDPTADDGVTAKKGLSPAAAARQERDRVWRYREFRGLDVPTMRQVLTDPYAIETYKKDPFNPDAIARLRLSAYQKCIVMKYVDNLIDWGDSLFAQFTMESVNEATMVYVLASEILGQRPAELGDCGDGIVSPKTYEKIAPLLGNGADFLVELETWTWVRTGGPRLWGAVKLRPTYTVNLAAMAVIHESVKATLASDVLHRAAMEVAVATGRIAPGTPVVDPRLLVTTRTAIAATGSSRETSMTRAALSGAAAAALETRRVAGPQAGGDVPASGGGGDRPAGPVVGGGQASGPSAVSAGALPERPLVIETPAALLAASVPVTRALDWNKARISTWAPAKDRTVPVYNSDRPLLHDYERIPHFGWSLVRQAVGPVFCVPENPDLLDYWNRVDKRLYQIRNCMDITGTRRQLALFAPEIDPRLLVRARAAGLSIEDVLNSTSGNLPPYRFTYLIEKARQYAATLQSFGSALLSALEKRDLDELNRLRIVQQQNILKMSTRMREWEIDIGADTVATLEQQKSAIEYRQGYYQGLIDGGLTNWETTQQISRHTATILHGVDSGMRIIAGVGHLVPQLGSPFAMKWGGVEIGSSATAWAEMTRSLANVADLLAASAGLEAGFERREDGWKHQVELAKHELDQVKQQLAAATVRKQIAVQALDVHKKSIDQLEEVYELYNTHFTNLGLYTWLSTTLQRVYREAYNGAYAMASLAEQAYRFERGDDTTPLLTGDYWVAAEAGLLAGEQLSIDIMDMERRFLETNYRTLEIDQSISLSQIDPAALVDLRETGTCQFSVPELIFDLFYPGHYRRRIRAARLTIPCVTGPYTNVSATLRLTGSTIRTDPQLGAGGLKAVPLRHTVSIATSSAQNDAGVFEFSFRDERYMPFEGAGAVSSWQVSLPSAFRQFDYQTINDVILHISYQAEEDGTLRDAVQQSNAALEGTILNIVSNQPMHRILSLRQDFSTAFNRLLHSPTGTPVKLELTDRYLPIFLRGRNIRVTAASLALRTAAGQTLRNVALTLDGAAVNAFNPDAQLGNLAAADVAAVFAGGLLGEHTVTVTNAGDLAPAHPAAGDQSALDPDRLFDVVLLLEYRLG